MQEQNKQIMSQNNKDSRTMNSKIAEEKVLKDYEKLIYKLANKQYLRYNKKYALEDILQEAKVSAIRAYRNYDVTKNTKLITHLYNYINFYLSHYFRSDTGLIKIPSRVMDNKEKSKPEIVQNDFLFDNSTEEHPSFDLSKHENKIFLDSLLKKLNKKEEDILSLIYLKGYTYDEVAIMYNVSRQAINNTANKCLKKLRENTAENH
jgi:RNA polymerase sigma factor (sigma-70 family)